MNKTARFSLVTIAIAIGTLYGPSRADADYIQTNLVSDIPGLATITDPSLVNPWGSSHSATSPFLDFKSGYQYIHSLRGDGQLKYDGQLKRH
jgi:hypothetical protein